MKKNLTWKAFGLICALGALTLVGCGSDTKTELIPINGGGDPTPEKEVNPTAAVVTYDVTAPGTLMATLEKVGKQTLVRYVDASGAVKEETFTGSFKKTFEIPVTSEGVEMAYEVLLLPKTQDELKALGTDQNLDFTGMGKMKFYVKYDDGTKSDEISAEEISMLPIMSVNQWTPDTRRQTAAAAMIVRVILVPVSPSGTGNTLSSFIYSLLLLILFAAEINAFCIIRALIVLSDIT